MSATPDDLPEIELSLDDLIIDVDVGAAAAPAGKGQPLPAAAAPSEQKKDSDAPDEGAEAPDPFADVPALTADRLPPNFRKSVDPASPAPMRAMAAKGLLPLNPSDMVHCLAMLTSDADEKISSAAKESIAKLPAKILSAAVRDDSLSPRVLDILARHLNLDQDEIEPLILNPSIYDATLAMIASKTSKSRFLEIMSGNQIRILRDQTLLRNLLKNPAMPRSVSDSVSDFAVRSGVILHDLPQFDAAYMRIFGKPVPRRGTAAEAEARGETAESVMKEMAAMSAEELSASTREEAEGEPQENPMRPAPAKKDVGKDGKKLSLTQRILNMNVSERIKLASMGNMEARTILLRDPNRMIQNAVINSPKISESEVLSLAQSKNTGDEVLRTIMSKREWTRQYRVRMALIHNPKTPAQTAIRMLDSLRENDVKKLAKDKNVPAAVQMAAKRKSTPKKVDPKK